MKQIYILTAFMLLATVTLKATVWTVSNDASQPAQWSSLQTACDSASAGDTIYVMGTSTSYGAIHVKKRLHLIGVGIKPEGNYLYGYPSYVSTISLDTTIYISGASGTIIEGLKIGSLSHNYSSKSIKNLIIRRNRITSDISLNYSKNILIINNIMTVNYSYDYLSLSYSNNIIIMNNIIRTPIKNSNSSTIISNNLFINGIGFSYCQSSTITNNIFYYSGVTGASYSNFSNNIGLGLSTNVLQGSNTGSNNINADPLFLYLYNTSDHSYNDQNKYKLKSTSPGKNAGTDGTDIGIYGGQYPWPASVLTDYIHCIPPTIPMMQELNIQNSSVPANGTLNFSVKAYKSSK